MMKKCALLLLSLCGSWLFSQKISSSRWRDLFSYNNVLALREDGDRLIAATENGIFYYNPATGDTTKLSKANGLHEVKISAFDYDAATKTGIVGYRSGAMDVISPAGISYIVDIPNATGFSGPKSINHISINGRLAVISANYGVSIFNLDKKEFGDSAFFLSGSTYTPVLESVIIGNTVYAATANAIMKHAINTTFAQYPWDKAVDFGASHLARDRDQLIFANGNNLYRGPGSAPEAFGKNISSISVSSEGTAVSYQKNDSVYAVRTLSGDAEESFSEKINTGLYFKSKIYAGSALSGVHKPADRVGHRPEGPYSNVSYRMTLENGRLWVSSGGKETYNNPAVSQLGYYYFDGSKWHYPEFFKKNPAQWNVMDVVPDPKNSEITYFTNYIFHAGNTGVFSVKDGKIYNEIPTNSSNIFNFRVDGLSFDENNNLFVSAYQFITEDMPLGYLLGKPDAGRLSLKFYPLAKLNTGGAQKPFAKDGILYFLAPFGDIGGLILRDYGNNPANESAPTKILNKDNGFPLSGVVSAALDKNDELWIGTRGGLRILSNPKAAIREAKPQTQNIVISQNGLGEELFRNLNILQIAVDSGNQKWVSTEGGGVFYLSPDGQRTLLHFTKENSPLPTNEVTDIKIDDKSGEVYFATREGIMVYKGDAAMVSDKFGNLLVYPNPVVAANYKGNVHIRGLAERTNIRITDAAGNLVHQGVARGGYYEWDLTNRGRRVASGIYFVLMTNADGTDKSTAKIAVVN